MGQIASSEKNIHGTKCKRKIRERKENTGDHKEHCKWRYQKDNENISQNFDVIKVTMIASAGDDSSEEELNKLTRLFYDATLPLPLD